MSLYPHPPAPIALHHVRGTFSQLGVPIIVSKGAKIWNRYNQVPHLQSSTTPDPGYQWETDTLTN